jgi:BirA family biotin operon repressor/biotin-[acetyl-CoA-carboxylase] ligase
LIEDAGIGECTLIAETQTDGVGRCGRQWLSSKGNLAASIIIKLPFSRDLGQLSLAVACALHSVLLHHIPNDLYLHWPNDVYYKKSKIAGILIAVIDSTAVISLGVNVDKAPDGVDAACIKEACMGEFAAKPEEILKSVLSVLDGWLGLNFSDVRNYWLRYINEVNCNVTIRNGEDLLIGLCRGLDNTGKLILEKDGRHLLISSGDMFTNMKGHNGAQ